MVGEMGDGEVFGAGGLGRQGSRTALTEPACGPAIGIFEGTLDLGGARPGATRYTPSSGLYRVTGGGVDVWGRTDALHLAWQRFQGDGAVSADIAFAPGHRSGQEKALLLLRQNFDPGAPYVGVVLRGDGRISLQFRQAVGGVTFRIGLFPQGVGRFSLRRHGGRFTAWAGRDAREMRELALVVLPMRDPLIAGIGMCAHNAEDLATAHFARVRVGQE